MKIVGFIPARGGSQRTPRKNLQPILGTPLFLWAANNLSRVLAKDHIYVDSDSDEILDLAQHAGFQTIKRPADLATNLTDGNRFMLWEVSQIEADVYVQHLPPMPFLREQTLQSAIEHVTQGDYDSSVAVQKTHLYLWQHGRPTYDSLNIPNSFSLPPTIIETMGLYVTSKTSILYHKTRYGINPYLQEIDKIEAIDIDYPEDLDFARLIARGLGPNSEYTAGILNHNARKRIKLLVIDVDGTLTDGGMYYLSDGTEMKKFNTKDGLAIKRLIAEGCNVGFLSSGIQRTMIEKRAETLGVRFVYCGGESKMNILTMWMKEIGVELQDVAYIGDDINDLSVKPIVGCFACPADASSKVCEISDIVLTKNGGNGCVREFIDNHLNLLKA